MAWLQKVPPDWDLIHKIRGAALQCANHGGRWLFIETTGGVNSPGPSGTTQADLYRPLRLPVILIGDYKPGGISHTISAFESLRMRGYDVEMVLIFWGEKYRNYRFLTEYFWSRYKIPVKTISLPPPVKAGDEKLQRYYHLASATEEFANYRDALHEAHISRIDRLVSMPEVAKAKIWFPFAHHSPPRPEDLIIVDSAHGDHFQTTRMELFYSFVYDGVLLPTYDGSASWWTQGLGHGNSTLSLAAAYAAGRYGDVTMAGAVHEPGLKLAETLLGGLKNPRLTRAFFSDTGSTGIKVALEMAVAAACYRYHWDEADDIEVLGLNGTYHGENYTAGHMKSTDLNRFDYNVDWHKPKGLWLDYPWVSCVGGQWTAILPTSLSDLMGADTLEFASLHEVFDLEMRDANIREIYEAYIRCMLEVGKKMRRKFGALIVEPIVIGAGGMLLV